MTTKPAGLWNAVMSPAGVTAMMSVAAGLAWIIIFGWVSRRIERQADAFAVRSLTLDRAAAEAEREATVGEADGAKSENDGRRVRIDPASAAIMVTALEQVARLNHIPVHRRSWRHGSIAWRQAYLRRLVGRPADALPIDRQMTWIKAATFAAVIAMIVLYAMAPPALSV